MTEQTEQPKFPTPERYMQHALAYGNTITQAQYITDASGKRLTPYDETQCQTCPHEHVCCNFMVGTTPIEAMGILAWLKMMRKDFLLIMRAVRFRAQTISDHMAKFPQTPQGRISAGAAWAANGLKCVFYDREKKRCGIYPVRPIACRLAFGQGDCTKDGVKGGDTHPAVSLIRARRVRVTEEDVPNTGELTILCDYVGRERVFMDEDTRELLNADPADLTEAQVIFGLAGPPAPQLKPENNDGSPQRAGIACASPRP